MNAVFKRRIENALSSRPVTRFTRLRTLGKRLILAYHGVRPDSEERCGEQSLFVPLSLFREHLDMLADVADVAPLSRIDEEGDGRPRVAITFDDAYAGAVVAGSEALKTRSLPATFFVVPQAVGTSGFWWDALAAGDATLDPSLRDVAVNTLGGVDSRVRQWAAKANLPGATAMPGFARPASLDQLLGAVKSSNITIGSHSWEHANLAMLSAEALKADLVRSRTWVRQQFQDRSIDWLAYPYGLESPMVQRAAMEAGYAGALRVSGGWHRRSEINPFARPRFNVAAGLSTAGLRSRILGGMMK